MSTITTKLFFDGACRGNGGSHARSAIGYVIVQDGREIATGSKSSSAETNNQAEYKALLHGLRRAKALGVRQIMCCGDSRLVVMQMRGLWAVNNPRLATLRDECKAEAARFVRVSFKWIARSENARADALANEALDRKE